MWSQSTNVTDGRTDDMRSQDRCAVKMLVFWFFGRCFPNTTNLSAYSTGILYRPKLSRNRAQWTPVHHITALSRLMMCRRHYRAHRLITDTRQCSSAARPHVISALVNVRRQSPAASIDELSNCLLLASDFCCMAQRSPEYPSVRSSSIFQLKYIKKKTLTQLKVVLYRISAPATANTESGHLRKSVQVRLRPNF